MICEIVNEHEKQNNGKIDIKWLEEHAKSCEKCKIIMKVIVPAMADMLSIDSDEEEEYGKE